MTWEVVKEGIQRRLYLFRAQALSWSGRAAVKWGAFQDRHGLWLELAYWTIALLATIGLVSWLQPLFEAYASKDNIASYKALYLSVGQAMIGATAIAGTFVLFAMQVNAESLPYGLFRRFSSDRKLLSAFFVSILIAIALTCLSLSDAEAWTGVVMAAAIWMVALNLRLLLAAYRRSLDLISPMEQLRLLRRESEQLARSWQRRIRWLAPVVVQMLPQQEPAVEGEQVDWPRHTILRINSDWASNLHKNVAYAVSSARRAAERGDTDAAGMALSTVLSLNANYISVKGHTFFSENPLVPNGMSTDGFINETLEDLKRLAREATSRSDERTVEQVFKTLQRLIQLYLRIEYPGIGASKTHAMLATGYLQSAVENLIPARMTDSLMEGVRVMGQAAMTLINQAGAEHAVGLMEKIMRCGVVGVLRPEDRPVTLTAMSQLTSITLTLFRSRDADLHFAFGEMQKNVKLVTELMLNAPDNGLARQHSTYLGPYFSSFRQDSLCLQMSDLVNAVVGADAQSADAARIVRNIEEWADSLFADIRELLKLAVEKRTHFSLDLIQWTENVTKLLLVLATAPVCDEHHREKLRKHADWLVSNFSWIPTDEQTARFVEAFRLAEHLFQIALSARRFEAPDVIDTCRKQLLKWALEAGAHQTGWGTLEHGLLALIALSTVDHEMISPDELKRQLTAKLALPNIPDQEMRDRAARRLRNKARNLGRREFETNVIDNSLTHGDIEVTRTLIVEVAAILSSGTVGEAHRHPFA